MNIYWVPSATFVLADPLWNETAAIALTHYTRSLFVAAMSPEEARSVIADSAKAEKADVLDIDGVEETSIERLPGSRASNDLTRAGILWRSGRVFFPAS